MTDEQLLSDERLDLMEQWERRFPSYRMVRGNVADERWGRDIPLLSSPASHTDVLDLIAHARVQAERIAVLESVERAAQHYRECVDDKSLSVGVVDRAWRLLQTMLDVAKRGPLPLHPDATTEAAE